MEKIEIEDFKTGLIEESGYYLFRNNKSKAIKAGHVDNVFKIIEIIGEASINVSGVSYEGAMEYIAKNYTWFRVPIDFRDE